MIRHACPARPARSSECCSCSWRPEQSRSGPLLASAISWEALHMRVSCAAFVKSRSPVVGSRLLAQRYRNLLCSRSVLFALVRHFETPSPRHRHSIAWKTRVRRSTIQADCNQRACAALDNESLFAGTSRRPSAWTANRPASRGWTGPSLDHGQPPYWVRR